MQLFRVTGVQERLLHVRRDASARKRELRTRTDWCGSSAEEPSFASASSGSAARVTTGSAPARQRLPKVTCHRYRPTERLPHARDLQTLHIVRSKRMAHSTWFPEAAFGTRWGEEVQRRRQSNQQRKRLAAFLLAALRSHPPDGSSLSALVPCLLPCHGLYVGASGRQRKGEGGKGNRGGDSLEVECKRLQEYKNMKELVK